jgi:regulator of ribonuclease activity A
VAAKTADLCDAHPEAQVCGLRFSSWGRRRAFEGRIRTVACRGEIGLIRQVVAQPGKDCVLVIDNGGALDFAVFGDAMAGQVLRNRWSGVVIHGAIRDVAEIDAMQVGVKALGTYPRRARVTDGGEIDVPVIFGDVTFVPGAWLVADEDGVVVVPDRPGPEAG